MPSITATLSSDHRRCDEIFADAEAFISQGEWERGAPRFSEYRSAMEHHFSLEENVLFPAFEQRTGHTEGPTEVMRSEHAQMRELLVEMAQTIEQRDADRYLGLSETLLMITQQHNIKEEQMLYRMADQVLGDGVGEVFKLMDFS